MKVQYGDACLSLQQVYEWTREFMNGIRKCMRQKNIRFSFDLLS